jgi:hypothetical protein
VPRALVATAVLTGLLGCVDLSRPAVLVGTDDERSDASFDAAPDRSSPERSPPDAGPDVTPDRPVAVEAGVDRAADTPRPVDGPPDQAPPAPDIPPASGFDSTGLVAYYRLDEAAGLAAHDSSGNGNDGALIGYPAAGDWRPGGKLGGTLGFSGAQWVKAAQSASLDSVTSAISLVAWVWRNAGAGGSIIHRQYQTTIYEHFQLAITIDGRINVWMNNQNQGTSKNTLCNGLSNAVPAGYWIHVAVTYDGAQARIYVNGQQACSENRTGGFSGYQRPLTLGAQLEHASDADPIDFFGGQLDEVMLWSRALSAAEVQALYAGAQPGAR